MTCLFLTSSQGLFEDLRLRQGLELSPAPPALGDALRRLSAALGFVRNHRKTLVTGDHSNRAGPQRRARCEGRYHELSHVPCTAVLR